MEEDNLHNREYIKSRFRCPICGTLVGCSEQGKIGMFSVKAFHRHVRNCREAARVKPGRIRYENDE